MSSRILIVEDEAVVALELEQSLQRLRHEVVGVADNSDQAVRMAQELEPDLVMMDIRLKGDVDGITTAATIRELTGTPVIYLTAYSGDDILDRAKQTEPYGYLLKPVQEEALETAIRMAEYKHLKDRETREQASRFSSVLRSIGSGVVVTDVELNVAYVNATAESILGVSNRDAVGRQFDRVVRLSSRQIDESVDAQLTEVVSEGASCVLNDHHLVRADGLTVPVDIELTAMRGSEGEVSGMVCTIFDARNPRLAVERCKYEAGCTGPDDPAVETVEDLRSYLEVEIVRLLMDAGSATPPVKYFREGQIAAYKRVIMLLYGERALNDFLVGVSPG